MPALISSGRKNKFLPFHFIPEKAYGIGETPSVIIPSQQVSVFKRELEALGEAIFAGDSEDANRRLQFFKRMLGSSPHSASEIWQDLALAAEGRLRERTEKGLLEAAMDAPGIPWKSTDKHLLFLARALQESDQPRAKEERRALLSFYETGGALYLDEGLERAHHLASALASRMDWENPYASRTRINEAVVFAMERLACSLSQYLADAPAEEDPKREELKKFFSFLAEEQNLMFVLNPTRDAREPGSGSDELSEQEQQYLGSNIIFYRQMMGNGYLSVFGNIVLGTLAFLKDEQARNRFLTAQYRNIRCLAKRYDTPGVERMDLIQTAWIGLEKALEIYEPWKGTLFWTLAKKWVFGAIVLEFKKTLKFLRNQEPVPELEGQSYQESLESLIAHQGLNYGPGTIEPANLELSQEEAREFVDDLMPLLDEHDKSILLAWMQEPNMVKVAEQFGTSKQNVSNALNRIQNAGRQLAHERDMLPPSVWEKFRRAELAAQTQRLLAYAQKKAAGGANGSRLKLQTTRILPLTAPSAPKRQRPLIAAEKAGLLAIAQCHFEEDADGKTQALRRYRELFLSGKEDQARYYLEDLAQRLDFESDLFKDHFLNLAILELFHSLSWKFKTQTIASAVLALVQTKILQEKEPPQIDVISAAKRFLEHFPARSKTPELAEKIQNVLKRLSSPAR